jgi:TPR repeat protein
LSPDALASEGEKYLYGSGAPEDCSRALKSLRAASAASSRAQSLLGSMYATGHCVAKDLPEAYRWFATALHNDPENPRISQDLEVIWRQMGQKDRQRAIALTQPKP